MIQGVEELNENAEPKVTNDDEFNDNDRVSEEEKLMKIMGISYM